MSKRNSGKAKRLPLPSITPYLDQANHLLRSRQWQAVNDLLTPLTDRYPNHIDLWAMLGDARTHLNDVRGLWEVSEAMLRLEPQAPDNWFNQANVAMANQMPFTALYYAHEYLHRFPDNSRADRIRKDLKMLEEVTASMRSAEPGRTDQDYMELEQANLAVAAGQIEYAAQLSRRTAERSPQLIPPRNNLAMIYALQANLDEGLALARSVLSEQPDNVHALSNLIMLFVFQGKSAEAQEAAERLERLTLSGDLLLKQLQALTYLGMDRQIVERFEEGAAAQTKADKASLLYAMTCHLAAVAYAHLGDVKRAKQCWQEALKVDRGLALARANLDNLAAPVGKRVKAFPFDLRAWIPRVWLAQLVQAGERVASSKGSLKKQMNRFLQANPGVEAILPVLWERGDQGGREFAVRIAEAAHLPLLRDFVLSESGTDEERMDASQRATKIGLFSPGEVISMVIKGQLTQIMIMNFEITDEPDQNKRPRTVQRLIEAAHAKLKSGNVREAETLARESIAQVPDEPSLWNFLAVSLDAQHKDAEYEAVTREIVERFPDYFFGQIGLARVLIRHNQTPEARDILQPLMGQRKMHVSQFAALCTAEFEMLLVDRQYEGAKHWLDMWANADPDNPAISYFRRKLLFKK